MTKVLFFVSDLAGVDTEQEHAVKKGFEGEWGAGTVQYKDHFGNELTATGIDTPRAPSDSDAHDHGGPAYAVTAD